MARQSAASIPSQPSSVRSARVVPFQGASSVRRAQPQEGRRAAPVARARGPVEPSTEDFDVDAKPREYTGPELETEGREDEVGAVDGRGDSRLTPDWGFARAGPAALRACWRVVMAG